MNRHKFTVWTGVLLMTCAVVAQADTVVAPNADATANGGAEQFGVFGNDSASVITFQWDTAASQLTSLVGEDITGIGFRLAGGDSSITTPTTIGAFSLELSGSLNPIGSLNQTPANNIASNGVTVYDNPSLVIPANSFIGGTGPNPFYVINFTTPFLYAGGDLLVTDTNPGTAFFAIDAVSVTGSTVTDTAGCFNGVCAPEVYNSPVTEFLATPGTSTVPEPSSLLLCAFLSLAGAAAARKRKSVS
jgi:hypothetical protein